MRDILICVTAVMMLGGGISIGRHYGANQAAEPEKIMVGPDGVAFVRSGTAKPAVVEANRPVAPEFDDLTKQAKASAIEVVADAVVETETLPLPAVVVATIPTKSAGLMVGPDGVVYHQVRKEVR